MEFHFFDRDGSVQRSAKRVERHKYPAFQGSRDCGAGAVFDQSARCCGCRGKYAGETDRELELKRGSTKGTTRYRRSSKGFMM